MMGRGIGDNGAPEPTPLEQHTDTIDSFYLEASNWLDGVPIANQAQADEVTRLRALAKETAKSADTQRAAEKKPHDDAGKAVQAAWKPLLDKAGKVETAANGALAKWLTAEQERKRLQAAELDRLAREEADKARTEHAVAAASGDLAAVEAAEGTVANAAFLASEARSADRYKPQAKVAGMARAVGLRTVHDVALSDSPTAERDLLRWWYGADPRGMVELALAAAQKAARTAGGAIPGCTVTPRQIV